MARRTASCPTCSDTGWTPGDTCFRCGDTPKEGRDYVLEGRVDCPECEGDPDRYLGSFCQHPRFVDWD